jgi:hypothetical protein
MLEDGRERRNQFLLQILEDDGCEQAHWRPIHHVFRDHAFCELVFTV